MLRLSLLHRILQSYQKSGVSIVGGALKLESRKEWSADGSPYISGKIVSRADRLLLLLTLLQLSLYSVQSVLLTLLFLLLLVLSVFSIISTISSATAATAPLVHAAVHSAIPLALLCGH
jgi:hypothetical protein